jgi:glycosyltransferase involved in cell wall biosynthesis
VKEPTFSVIITTYARPRYLSEAVRSVLDQTVADFECLVVDDASPEPAETCEDPRVRVIRRASNGGPAAARNTGLDQARGRFVTFLDDDDIYAPTRLEIALEGLTRAPLAICHAQYLDAAAGRNRRLEGHVWDTILDDTTPHCGATSVARESAVRFDESFDACEDIDWWLRMSHDVPVTTVPRVGLLLRRHSDHLPRTGLHARLEGSERLLEVHADYFSHHRAARAFRWKRVGNMALLEGDRSRARAAFTRSLRIQPRARTLAGLARSWARRA